MALSMKTSLSSPTNPLLQPPHPQQPPTTHLRLPAHRRPVSAVHAAEPAKTPSVASPKPSPSSPPPSASTPPQKWSLDSWRSKKALQLPEYPDEAELEAVLKTIESFPPIVFAGEARKLEERIADAAMGRAFLLQGGDCAESFKEFNANNIRDTFRILLQMGAVLMFGGQVPVVKHAAYVSMNVVVVQSSKNGEAFI